MINKMTAMTYRLIMLVALCGMALPASMAMAAEAEGQKKEINWIEGRGQTVTLGNGLAELTLNENVIFLTGADARILKEEEGETVTGNEIGFLFPNNENEQWGVYFEYEETGYIEESEKDKIDAKRLLKDYKKGTEEANKELAPENHVFVDGWDVEPFYDEKLHALSWALLGHTAANEKLVNYTVNILTRQGVISLILVTDPENLAADRIKMEEQVLSSFRAKEGNRYEDYNPSIDKKAEYGLSGLVLGGAGLLVAKKVGLLGLILVLVKKFGIIVIIAIGAVWGWLSRLVKKKRDHGGYM